MPYNWFQKPLRLPKVPHSLENLSHNFKTTSKFGLATPIGIEELVPSDRTLEYRPCAYIRMSPLLYPIMHQVHVRFHTFDVPLRILLGEKAYEKWLNSKLEFPTVRTTYYPLENAPEYDIWTTLGYPRRTFTEEGISYYYYEMENGLDYLAIMCIWINWFADSQIDDALIAVCEQEIESYQAAVEAGSANYTLSGSAPYDFNVRLGKDYFTTARPEPQYGDPVNLTSSPTKFNIAGDVATVDGEDIKLADQGDFATLVAGSPYSDDNQLTLDLTIRELWRREQIQRFWDIDNTFGTRTREWLAGHMGVIFPDDRLMIPRLMQTVDKVMNISEVLQTSETTSDSPLGAYAGKGSLAISGPSFKRTYLEHGLLITLMSIIPETGYASSRPRYQFKKSIFDFAIPEFNNIGYQEIFKGEIFGDQSFATAKDPWAYTMRYSEYRSHPNRCTNGFAKDATLIDFHLNRKFDSLPGLNPAFIDGEQQQFYRIFADEEADMDSFLVDAAIIHKMWRPVSSQPSSMHL